MKLKKQEFVVALSEALAPQLSAVVPAGQKPPKSVLKTIRHLAEQLARLHAKQAKRTAKAALPTGKETRQKLTDELVAVLDAHFAQDELAEQETQLLTETAEELAAKLTKFRVRQAHKAKKGTPADSVSPEQTAEAASTPPPPPTKRTGRQARQKTLPPVAASVAK